MLRRVCFSMLLGSGLLALAAGAFAGGPHVDVLTVKGTVNPVMASYIDHGISTAESDGAALCVIEIDTPGGLDTSMRDIVQSIVGARVPVAVYVSPAGGRTASAGVFITMAAHVAAMAPNTSIGAAHPVSIGSSGEVQELPEDMEEKILNDAVAYIKSIAGGHGRNVEWAERAVRESICATEQEALELGIIDLVAPDLSSLLSEIDGREVAMMGGGMVTIHTEGAAVHRVEMGAIQRFLFAISDPTIAYILLSLGMLGIFFELSSPGTIFPGVFGGICFLLGLYSLDMLSVNYAGILLMVLGFGLLVAELFTPTFGLLTAGGVASFITGSLILFGGGSSLMQISIGAIVGVVVFITAIFVFVIWAVVRGQRRRPVTGGEGLVGKAALVRTVLDPAGTVFLEGEAWNALVEGDMRVKTGEEVIVTRVDGLKLYVTKK